GRVSTTKVSGAEGCEALPAASVAVAVTECVCGAPNRSTVEAQLQAPLLAAVAVHSCVPPSEAATVVPACAVPLNVGRVLAVGEGVCAMLGTAGGTVSTTRSRCGAEAGPVIPAREVATAESW